LTRRVDTGIQNLVVSSRAEVLNAPGLVALLASAAEVFFS
jgi:hypothetical protein